MRFAAAIVLALGLVGAAPARAQADKLTEIEALQARV